MNAELVSILAAAAVGLAWSGSALLPDENQAGAEPVKAEDRSLLVRLRAVLCCLAAVAGWVVLGGGWGMVLGVVAGALSWRAITRVESPGVIRRRQELERDLPVAVQLLGSCLAAGAAVGPALSSVAESMPGAVGDALGLLQRRLYWGVDPVEVWRSVGGPLEPLGRTMARAHESGASVELAVTRLAEDLRQVSRARADARARTIEVRAAAPLGLCFLPSFVIIGVIPLVVGLFSSLQLFR